MNRELPSARWLIEREWESPSRLRVATSDASWFDHPRLSGHGRRYHVILDIDGEDKVACGTLMMPNFKTAEQADGMRCKRPGCKQRWQQIDEEIGIGEGSK